MATAFVAVCRDVAKAQRREWKAGGEGRAASLAVALGDKPVFPDFLIIRKSKHGLVVDLLDPHLPDLADSAPKAVGLAKFAGKHDHKLGRIELIIVDDQIKRLNLAKEATREKVRIVTRGLLAVIGTGRRRSRSDTEVETSSRTAADSIAWSSIEVLRK